MADEKKGAMTKADAAKMVKRPVFEVVEKKDSAGKVIAREEVRKLVAVKADEVLAFREYPDRCVVVTTDGQKFSSLDAA